jgi:hypothetical protein
VHDPEGCPPKPNIARMAGIPSFAPISTKL